MNRSFLFFFGFCLLNIANASNAIYSGPIIDMHLHSYDDKSYWGGRSHRSGASSPKTAAEHLKLTIEQLDKLKIERAAVSGTLSSVKTYAQADQRFIPGYSFDDALPPLNEFEKMLASGEIKIFGEIGAVYYGKSLADPVFDPYLALCAKYDVPVAYHTGGGPVNIHAVRPKFRLSEGNPVLIEPVLVKYPKLRVYLMHAGEVYYEEAVRMMVMFPNLYADLGVLLWVHDLPKSYAVDFLKRAQTANILDRVMFGSDQMVWPEGIEKSVEFLNSLDFVTQEQKANIFYHNARRFLKIK